MEANLLLKKLFLITLTCFVVSGCASNSEETIDSSSSLNWMDEFIEVQEDLDSQNVYTFVCACVYTHTYYIYSIYV